MKYMLLMQFSAATADFPSIDTWTPQELQDHIAFMIAVDGEMRAAGELVDSQGLAGADTVKIVRGSAPGTYAAPGAPVVTEGPFPETKEFLAGYWVIDADTEQRALDIAAYVSGAPGPGGAPLNMPIEVRPVMSGPPEV